QGRQTPWLQDSPVRKAPIAAEEVSLRLRQVFFLFSIEKKPGPGNPLHTPELVTVASFRTWRGWRECVAWDRYLTLSSLPFELGTIVPFPSHPGLRKMGNSMASSPRQSVITLPAAIERYFQVSLYLL